MSIDIEEDYKAAMGLIESGNPVEYRSLSRPLETLVSDLICSDDRGLVEEENSKLRDRIGELNHAINEAADSLDKMDSESEDLQYAIDALGDAI